MDATGTHIHHVAIQILRAECQKLDGLADTRSRNNGIRASHCWDNVLDTVTMSSKLEYLLAKAYLHNSHGEHVSDTTNVVLFGSFQRSFVYPFHILRRIFV